MSAPDDASRRLVAQPAAEPAAAVELIAYVRWAGVGLGVLQALTVTDPQPLGGPWFVLLGSLVMAAYNVPATLARRFGAGTVGNLRWACLAGDFAVCTAWTMLVANDIYSTAYAIYILVGIEAAFLYRVRGAAVFSLAFVLAYVALYWERAALFHFPVLFSSLVFRSSIVLIAVGFASAITEQSQRRRTAALAAGAEARLQADLVARRSEELDSLLRAISDMGEGVVTIRERRIVDANEAFCHLTGYPIAELRAFPTFLDAVAPESRDALTGRTRLEDLAEASGETVLITRNGERIPVDWTTRNIQVEDGVQVVAVVRDIRERRRVLQLIESERDRAEQASRAKTEYLSRMSHELRTPMTVILGFAELFKLQAQDDGSEAADSILKAGSHLLSLINDALDISRIESGRDVLSLEPVPLASVIDECVRLMRPLLESRHMSLQVSLPPQVAEHVEADRQRLAQVLLNLLSNAVKYAEPGASIALSATMVGSSRVRVAVSDNGPGIAENQLPLVFEPFERLGAERTTTPGTGLGLSLARKLVEAMGGEIGVVSQVGTGTTFWIVLRMAMAAAERLPEPQPQAVTSEARAESSRVVLYVEDNVATIELVERIVAMRPAVRLLTAMQGSWALDLAREHSPSLIIVDVHLPDMDGLELVQLLKSDERTRDIPVIVLSADATQWQVDRLLGAGAARYLIKPVTVAALLAIIDTTLGGDGASRAGAQAGLEPAAFAEVLGQGTVTS